MKPDHLRILTQLHDRPWAITARALNTILAIVERDAPVDLEAVAARLGRPLENTGNNVQMHGSVAVLGVEGPIFRKANLFTELSGATSVELLSRDFHAALDNSMVSQIVLNINSPGGQVDGIGEFADQVRAGAAKKPVTAYVDGLAASAAYWIASAAQSIVANESAFLGSIGVVATITDRRDAQERQGVRQYEIVSSQSPNKRADVRTDEGRAQIQDVVDALAEIFIGKVAQFRGTTPESVIAGYGGGKILVARQAIAAGMADQGGTFESLLAALRSGERMPTAIFIGQPKPGRVAQEPPLPAADVSQEEGPMAEQPTQAAPAAAVNPDPGAERQRIAAILTCEEAQGREALARTLALETDQDLETARRILRAAATNSAPTTAKESPVAAAMKQLKNPEVGAGNEAVEDTPQVEAQRILAFVPRQHRSQTA
jgi:signal peptide peptidase SppA